MPKWPEFASTDYVEPPEHVAHVDRQLSTARAAMSCPCGADIFPGDTIHIITVDGRPASVLCQPCGES